MDLNVKITIPAVEMLLKYAASGFGSVAGTMLAPWKAGTEARAALVTARGEIERQKLLRAADQEESTMAMISDAQANARNAFVSEDQSASEILDMVSQRIAYQEAKRQGNITTVTRLAAAGIEDSEVPDGEPDHDWTARFFNYIQDISSQEMQSLWARVLQGEVIRQGSTSIRTLSVLRNLDRPAAELFRRLCSACVFLEFDGRVLDARVPTLGQQAARNGLKKYGLDYLRLTVLHEHGLVTPDFDSWRDYRLCIGVLAGQTLVRVPFTLSNNQWVLVSTSERGVGNEFQLFGVALTQAGRELAKIVDLMPMDAYVRDLKTFLAKKGLTMSRHLT